jgi:phosphohistidine swiveling domain-containing protein
MRLLTIAAVLACAGAFTTQPAAFTTKSAVVGERASFPIVAENGISHRTRRATIVMDGKANGEFYVDLVRTFHTYV